VVFPTTGKKEEEHGVSERSLQRWVSGTDPAALCPSGKASRIHEKGHQVLLWRHGHRVSSGDGGVVLGNVDAGKRNSVDIALTQIGSMKEKCDRGRKRHYVRWAHRGEEETS